VTIDVPETYTRKQFLQATVDESWPKLELCKHLEAKILITKTSILDGAEMNDRNLFIDSFFPPGVSESRMGLELWARL
jgi:hypothetical protein